MFSPPWYEWPLVCGARSRGVAWLRVCGFGVVVKDRTVCPELYSERNGLRRLVRLGRYTMTLLTPRT